MRKLSSFVFTLALATSSLGACSQDQDQDQDQASVSSVGYLREAVGQADIAVEGDLITATRNAEGRIGVVIRPAPVQVTFTVDDPSARIRARQDGEWIELSPGTVHSVLVGRGGASQLRVETLDGDAVAVRVLSVVECVSMANGCTPLPAATPGGDDDTAP